MIQISMVGLAKALAKIELVTAAIEHVDLERATEVVYEHTRQQFDAWGAGRWPPLAESTVERKASQGFPEPDRPLYAAGNLYESVTSPHGPYSFKHVGHHRAVIGADWDKNGWQIPVILSAGTKDERIPARPIWPPLDDHDFRHDLRHAVLGPLPIHTSAVG